MLICFVVVAGDEVGAAVVSVAGGVVCTVFVAVALLVSTEAVECCGVVER